MTEFGMKKERGPKVPEYGTRTAEALLEFVERATKAGATAAEVEALPAVARELHRLLFEG